MLEFIGMVILAAVLFGGWYAYNDWKSKQGK